MARLIFGCGFLGSRVAHRWKAAGETVYVVTRSDETARQFEETGYRPIVADVLQPDTLRNLPAAETVLYAVGYDRTAGVSIREVYVDGLRNCLEHLHPSVQTLIYISSTGVYGQTDGQWINERSECRPTRDGGRACLTAEQTLAASRLADHAIALRMAGLYGPGRLPSLDAVRSGQPIAVQPEGFLNLIHVEDAAEVVLSAERRATKPNLFLVSDGHPVSRRDYYAELARLVAAPPPAFAPPDDRSSSRTRQGTNKRVDISHLRAELDVRFTYPTFREGLASALDAE